MAIDKDALFKSRLGEEEIDVPGVGTVRIRALSRNEAMSVRGVDLGIAEMERKLLALALVDPVLTEDEVKQWQDASGAGEMEPIMLAVVRLSGMQVDAAKAEMQRFRE